jgi:hypothetical protein
VRPFDRLAHAGDTAPRLRVHTLDGSFVELAQLDAESVLGLVDELNGVEYSDGEPVFVDEPRWVFSFDLDDGRSQVHIPRHAIARVDVDWQVGILSRAWAWCRRMVDRLR